MDFSTQIKLKSNIFHIEGSLVSNVNPTSLHSIIPIIGQRYNFVC